MANEFKHKSAGAVLTQTEDDAVDRHCFNSQAKGDILYASSATQLSRLGITDSRILGVSGGVPAWVSVLPAMTLGGTITLNNQVFDAGSGKARINTTGQNILTLKSTYAGSIGATVELETFSPSPANNDIMGRIEFRGYNDNVTPEDICYGRFLTEAINVADGSEEGRFEVQLVVSGGQNVALRLSGAGILSVDLAGSGDAAQVDLFDDYDDALVLRQGIQQNNRELLSQIGILERKDTGSGYFLKIQPMIRLLAGGIYQTRQILDDKIAYLESKISKLEMALPQGG